jgi:hypothetical protein
LVVAFEIQDCIQEGNQDDAFLLVAKYFAKGNIVFYICKFHTIGVLCHKDTTFLLKLPEIKRGLKQKSTTFSGISPKKLYFCMVHFGFLLQLTFYRLANTLGFLAQNFNYFIEAHL